MTHSKRRAAGQERRRLNRKAKAQALRKPGTVRQIELPAGTERPWKWSPRKRAAMIGLSVASAIQASYIAIALQSLTGWFRREQEDQAA